MFLRVDTNDSRSLYQQVVDGVKALIARGGLREGAVLPSVRQVAGDLGVNLNTIAVAYRQLEEEGFLRVRHGVGAVVTSRRATGIAEEDLRRPLRTALTQLVLTGRSDKEIASVIQKELRTIRRTGESE